MAGSDIEVICQEASMIAIREFVRAGCGEDKLQLSRRHFDLAIEGLKGRKGE
jgi:SpoVK/Ycf46/Vps4 family AAA+-type ATPase